MLPNLINMLSWWQWSILAAVPPAIIALYFLKLKREPLEVPSTYLWHKSIEDLHVNSIWQRLRKSLLLLLQLLLVALVMMALLRPSWRGSALSGDRFIFLVDHSASMSATDVEPSRLENAKLQISKLIDQMKSGDRAMIISFADNAQVVQEFTDNRRQLQRRLKAIEPTERTTSLLTALKLAAGMANPGRISTDNRDVQVADALPADVFIFSDGKFPDVQGFSLGNLRPIYVPVGEVDISNVAITAFSTRRHETKANELQAFGQVENIGAAEASVTAELYHGSDLIDADEINIPAGDARGVAFDLEEIDSGELLLKVKASDALAVDDVAYASVNPPQRGRVLLVSPGNDPLELALATSKAVELAEIDVGLPAMLATKQYQTKAAAGDFDLVIYDQCRPEKMPHANTLFIGMVPKLKSWGDADKPAEKASAPQIIDIDGVHPILQLIDLGDIDIAESLILNPPPGSTELIDSSQGIIFAIGPRDGFEDAVLGFELVGTSADGAKYANTNWPLRLSFPTFILNALQYLGGQQGSQAMRSTQPGEPVKLRSSTPVEQLTVRDPAGKSHKVLRGQRSEFQFHGADRVGIYEVIEEKKLTQRFSVNLFDRGESDIAARRKEAIQIGYVEVEGQAGFEPARREMWKLLLILALVILLLEWYIYNRRVYL